jgi:aminopeptidase N
MPFTTPKPAGRLMRHGLPLCFALAACEGGAARPPASAPKASPRAPTAAAPSPEPGLRLPAGVRPTREALDLSIDATADRFAGTATIGLEIDAPTDTVWLHAGGLTVKEASVEGASGAQIATWSQGEASDKLALKVPAPLGRGAATVRLRFEGPLDAEKSRGIYRVREPDGKWYAYTFFEPVDARRAFPCFDEPGFKIPWTLTLRVPTGDMAVANTRLASETAEGGRRVFTFEPSKPLPSYLVAFVTGPFEVVDAGTAGRHGTPLRFVLPPGRSAELGYAKGATSKFVGLLEDYFDLPYPFGKLDVAVVPRFWGTMEHPGIVALGQPLTLIKPGEETPQRRRRYANIAIHELGHYWFGDVVTAAWWDDIWLNEGLTTWLDQKITDRFEPAWRYAIEKAAALNLSLESDGLSSSKALRQAVTTPQAIEASFDAENTYFKGASVIGMVERWAGEEAFRRGIQRYFREKAWGSATSEDFLRAVGAEAGAQAAEALRTFVDQPGAPEIAADLRCSGGAARLHLAQRRYRPAGAEAQAGRGEGRWKVPVCYRYPAGKESKSSCHLLEGEEADVPLEAPGCPDWVLINDGAAGYYRSAYPAKLRDRLRALAPKGLSAPERVLLVGDVRAQVAAGGAELNAALELAASLAGEADYRVLGASTEALRDVKAELLPKAQQDAYARALRRLYGARARALGWLPKPGEGDDDALTRPWLVSWVAQSGQDPALRAEARKLADAWLKGQRQAPTDVIAPALSVAARAGDAAFFDALSAAAEKATDRDRRAAILGALGAFSDPALLERAFEIALGKRFDPRESRTIWYGALYRSWTRDAAWAYLRPRLDAFFAPMRDDEASQILRVFGAFCDRDRRAELAAALGPRAERINGGPLALAKTLERVELCADANARHQKAVAAFLSRY